MAFFKARQNITGDPFLQHMVSIQSDNYTTSFTSVCALRSNDVFAAVRVIASNIASSPIQLVKNNMPQADSELMKLLNKKPDSEMDGWHLKFALAVNMLLNGNSFAEIKRNGERVEEIHLLPNSSVTVTQLDNGTLSYQISDKKRCMKSSDILHLKYFAQDGLTGLPPLYASRDELKVQQAGNRILHNFFTRGVSGSGILKVHKSDLDGSARNTIREKFEEANGSSSGDNALRTIILDETMSYKALEIDTDVLRLINSNDWNTEQVARTFGVPIERLGVENEHSSTVQSSLQYIQGTLIHCFNVFVSELDTKPETNIRFNSDQLPETGPETKVKNVLDQVKGSLLTINEGQSKMGLSSMDGGDRLLASLNFTYLDTLEKYQLKEQEGVTPVE